MIWVPQIVPCVCAVLRKNDLAEQGREEVVITPQRCQCGGVTVRTALSLRHAQSRQGTQVLTPTHIYLCRQPFNLHRTGVCEQQSLSPPHLPVTRLVPHLSRCQGGPASGQHSQQQKLHCWHTCEKTCGKRSRAWPRSPRKSSCSQDTFLISEGNLSRTLYPKSM